MKILISSAYHLPHVSGITIYVQRLAEELARRGYQVTVLTAKHKANLKSKETINGVNIIRVSPAFPLGKGLIMPAFPSASGRESRKHDLVICHLPQLESFWPAIWSKIWRKKLIVVHHCEFGKAPGLKNKLIAIATYLPHYFVYSLADEIIAYTKDYADHSIFLQKFPNKTNFILPPVSTAKVTKKEIKKTASLLKKNKQTKIIGFVGRIGWEKGLDVLLETIPILNKKLKNYKIVMVGPYKKVVGDKTYQSLKPMLEKYKKNIILIGTVPHRQLARYYKNFDCLVLPSTNSLESFGLVQAEAMLCGCPVVATNLPGVRAPIALTGMGKIVPPKSPKKLARAIIKVVKNKNRYKQNLSKAKEKFSYQKTTDSYEKLFKKQ